MCRRPRGLSFLQLFGHKSAHFLLFQVFPEGLVASDGRLQPGDQIIEINGADMTCATHAQVKIMEAGVQWSFFITKVVNISHQRLKT